MQIFKNQILCSLNSGTDALLMSLSQLNLKKGSEIITTL